VKMLQKEACTEYVLKVDIYHALPLETFQTNPRDDSGYCRAPRTNFNHEVTSNTVLFGSHAVPIAVESSPDSGVVAWACVTGPDQES
jgi:hypothetical protein